MNNFLFVVVLYEMDMSTSSTVSSVTAHRALLEERGIRVLVIDNTPRENSDQLIIDNNIEYISVGENKGLANAYQSAFLVAKDNQYRFLVLLDQDSEVDSGFISALDNVASDLQYGIGIWCPDIISCGKRISPYSSNVFGWPNYSPSSNCRVLYGINSFSVVNVRLIDEIGGFNQFYWLDCLDSWLYEHAQRSGWIVNRLNVTVNHSLSLVSERISFARMKNIVFYESCFVVEYGSISKIVGTLLRLVLRGLKRVRMIGGIFNYGYYLHGLFKGASLGLTRRRQRVV